MSDMEVIIGINGEEISPFRPVFRSTPKSVKIRESKATNTAVVGLTKSSINGRTVLYGLTSGRIRSYDAETLDVIAETTGTLSFSSNNAFLIYNGILFTSTHTYEASIFNTTLYRFDALTLGLLSQSVVYNSSVANAPVFSSLAADGNTLFCGASINTSGGGAKKVYAYNAATLAKIGESAVLSQTPLSMVVANGIVFCGCGSTLASINALSLAKIKEFSTSIGATSLLVSGNKLFVGGATTIIAFDIESFTELYRTPQLKTEASTKFLAMDDDLIYATGRTITTTFEAATLSVVGYSSFIADATSGIATEKGIVYTNISPERRIIALTDGYEIYNYRNLAEETA